MTTEQQSVDTVPVRFDGDTIEAVRQESDVYVSIRRVCEPLELDYSSQLSKLKQKSWATVALITTVAEDGKRREMAMLHIDALPMWLATVSELRVSEELRPKLIRYQLSCARVLRDHFFGPRRPQQRELWPELAASPVGTVPKHLEDYERFMRRCAQGGACTQLEYAWNVRAAAIREEVFVPIAKELPSSSVVDLAAEPDLEHARRV